jgi:hypothetical protein
MILREAIIKTGYDWRSDGSNLPAAMMRIFQEAGVEVYDPATNRRFKRLDLLAAVDHVFGGSKNESLFQIPDLKQSRDEIQAAGGNDIQ